MAQTGQALNVTDVYNDPRFNAEVDEEVSATICLLEAIKTKFKFLDRIHHSFHILSTNNNKRISDWSD